MKSKELINENKSLKSELRSSANELKYLKDAYDDLEQYTRRECLEIKDIPCLLDPSKKIQIIL